ncbi:MAG TPA: pilus assembly protein N-terminal domain-containing protein [Gemmatimonadales bacterium]|nr:pilus assembly protein N-terminal domain-containing protein [Gemmatimonadales bacterium]
MQRNISGASGISALWRWTLAVVIVVLALTASPRAAAQRIVSGAQQVVTVSAGASALLVYDDPVERFSIGETTIADAVAVSPREVLVTGKKLGTTSLLVWDKQGTVRVYSIEVTADAPALERYLRTLFPGDSISVSASSNTVTLSGRVRSAAIDQQAVNIAKATGAVIVDRLQAPPGRQVLLQVQFAEVNRTAVKEMSSILSTVNPDRLTSVDEDSVQTISDGLMRLFLGNANAQFNAVIRALRARGEFKTLAEPNLLTLPGQEASFLAGGEFPYPSVQGGGQSGAITIVFKEFGVRLRFTPTLTEGGSIRLHVAPEVSSLDFANGLTLNGFQIPSLLTRRAETDVELRDGQHLAIAGLMDNAWTKDVSRIPILGDIPVLGEFFRSSAAQQRRTELLVVVTPVLVDASDKAPPLPTGDAGTWDWDRGLRRPGPTQH